MYDTPWELAIILKWKVVPLPGASLGLRFTMLILVPAIGLALALVAANGIVVEEGIWRLVGSMVVVATFIQLGYLGGNVLRLVIFGTRATDHGSASGAKGSSEWHSINLKVKRGDNRFPVSKVGHESLTEFFGVRVWCRFETSLDQHLLIIARRKNLVCRLRNLLGNGFWCASRVWPPFRNPPGYLSVEENAGILLGRARERTLTRDGRVIDMRSASIQDLIDAAILFCGTPDQVYEQIAGFADYAGGLGHLLSMGQGGFLSHQDTVDSMTLFGKEVLPRLKATQPVPP